jgi:hypothetical protein
MALPDSRVPLRMWVRAVHQMTIPPPDDDEPVNAPSARGVTIKRMARTRNPGEGPPVSLAPLTTEQALAELFCVEFADVWNLEAVGKKPTGHKRK